MSALPPRFDITAEEIGQVVSHFYARVRDHAVLAPIFAAHVQDWPAHEETVARFWRNAILNERGYEGSPMAAHLAAGDVRPGMFGPWLKLFDTVLTEELSPEKAQAWSALAHRIGRSLRAGVVERETLPGGVPKLF